MSKKIGYILSFMLIFAAVPVFAFMGSSYENPINVCAAHILVPTEEQALKIKSEINSFNDFKEMAKIYSECPSGKDGGFLGCFGRKQMVKEFEQAAFGGNVGEVTGPVKTEFGYHLIWVTRKF